MDLNCSHALSSVRARRGINACLCEQSIGQQFEHAWRPEVDHDMFVLLDHAVEVIRVQV
jgi:hypothetical protein